MRKLMILFEKSDNIFLRLLLALWRYKELQDKDQKLVEGVYKLRQLIYESDGGLTPSELKFHIEKILKAI